MYLRCKCFVILLKSEEEATGWDKSKNKASKRSKNSNHNGDHKIPIEELWSLKNFIRIVANLRNRWIWQSRTW